MRRNNCFMENDQDTGSESSVSTPKEKLKSNLASASSSISPLHHNASPSSPESDLDVDDSPMEDNSVPTNLSTKKRDRPKSPCESTNFNNNLGFLSYSESLYQHSQRILSNQRAPVDVLMRYAINFYKMCSYFYKTISSVLQLFKQSFSN